MSFSIQQLSGNFEWAVTQLQESLEYLANQKNLSKRFFNRQNKILRHLIEYYNHSLQVEDNYQTLLRANRKNYNREIRELQDRVLCFEAICIIHGIIDFPYWLSKTWTLLKSEAYELGPKREMRMPCLLIDKLNELPKEEERQIMQLLQKDLDQQIIHYYNRVKSHNERNEKQLRSC